MPQLLIVGASRGIGLEFVRQYAAAGAQVRATHRRPADAAALTALGAQPLALDVTDTAAIAALGQRLAQGALDVAVINAGVYGPRTQGIEAVTPADFDAVMHTNVLASMHLIPALAPALVAGRGKLAVISSVMGLKSRITQPSGWLYRASKAALNMVVKAASIELGRQGVVCMAFHPGWVRTDMGGAEADIDTAASVAGMRYVIEQASISHNGKFLNYTGEQFDW
jgi:NAD(P)-dependent dehydrogenase (short-subunit alcohol dehydrogenase family)